MATTDLEFFQLCTIERIEPDAVAKFTELKSLNAFHFHSVLPIELRSSHPQQIKEVERMGELFKGAGLLKYEGSHQRLEQRFNIYVDAIHVPELMKSR